MLSEALEETIAALSEAGRLERADSAVIESCRLLAVELDAKPWDHQLFREFRAFEQRLREGAGKGDDSVDRLLAQLSAKVGDPSDS